MSWPATRPYVLRDKRRDVALHVVLTVLGSMGAAWGLATVPQEQIWLRVLVWNGVWGVALSAALVVVMLAKPHLPRLRRTMLDGRPAWVVRSWDQAWWHTCGLDLGLLCSGVAMVLAGLAAGGREGLGAVLVAPLGLWFHVRFVLVVLGRRRRHALWLTADEVLLDSGDGRVRVPAAAVADVRAEEDRLVLALRAPGVPEQCPRGWREKGAALDGTELVLSARHTAHTAYDLAAWVRHRLRADLARDATTPPGTTGRRRVRAGQTEAETRSPRRRSSADMPW